MRLRTDCKALKKTYYLSDFYWIYLPRQQVGEIPKRYLRNTTQGVQAAILFTIKHNLYVETV
jgi:hypothetical protein